MKYLLNLICSFTVCITSISQSKQILTPELLWKVERLSGISLSKNGKNVVYSVSTPDIAEDRIKQKTFVVSIDGGPSVQILNDDSIFKEKKYITRWEIYYL